VVRLCGRTTFSGSVDHVRFPAVVERHDARHRRAARRHGIRGMTAAEKHGYRACRCA